MTLIYGDGKVFHKFDTLGDFADLISLPHPADTRNVSKSESFRNTVSDPR
jgi:hypothetical protein